MEPTLIQQLGGRVREERLQRRWTQKELILRANLRWHAKFPDQPLMQEKWLWTFEHAKNASTHLDWVAALASALSTPLPELLTPNPQETISHTEQRWRTAMQMHGISPSMIEDIVHAVRVIDTWTSPSPPSLDSASNFD